ncbi:MAG: peptide-methionine (S)-S-oxide reductase MsrA [Gemmataceae bacterium]|nr:peptide-methionine (S)-S-oxide reductase MsrA [Gemmataceae bacterium]
MRPVYLVLLLTVVAAGAVVAVFTGGTPGPAGPAKVAHVPPPDPTPDDAPADPAVTSEDATFGSGCFWCTEAVYKRVKGVTAAASGYTGGRVADPTYEQVCTGTTGHAEAVKVTFDPRTVSYPELLEVFWSSHDPTTRNRQGADVGTQYRSAVFTHSDRQRRLAEAYKLKLDAAGVFASPVVTEITPAGPFYPAEGYHQDYFALNPRAGYCRAVIRPKLDKLREVFGDRLAAP